MAESGPVSAKGSPLRLAVAADTRQGPSWPGEAARALKETGCLLKQTGLNMILRVLLRDELQGNSCVVLLGNQGLSVT